MIDILLVTILMYKLYELVKGTNALRIFFGALAIYLVWKLVDALQMQLMSEIFSQFISVGMIALIIVFQQEIRKFLMLIGNTRFFKGGQGKNNLWNWVLGEQEDIDPNVNAIATACFNMAKTKTGALIVIERSAQLDTVADSGKTLKAELTSSLLETIFFKNSPLHDGAVLVRDNTILAASCILPVTVRQDIPSKYGMRHRAAYGVTEEFDVITVTVSEETGSIAIFENGSMEIFEDIIQFRASLRDRLDKEQ